ncbi:MAG TPA: large conductance mechanosensitive channel protein MscL [Anaerolineae bacterium]|jgi:large conductance mechanosensitive channel
MEKPVVPVKAVPLPLGVMGEFQKFLTKSNAMALAIGVIIGAATGQVVNSLVEDIINPLIGVLLANVDLANAKIVLGTITGPDGKVVENALRYGNFISVLINFIIVMLVVFFVAKIVAKEILEK